MSSRFASAAKLTARLATTGIRSRVQAAKSFSLPRAVASPIASGRLFSTSPFPASPVPSNLETLGSSEPTLAEEQVKADSEDTVDPLAEEPHHAAAAAAPVEGNCSVFVGGLSWNIDNDWLQAELEKQLDTTDGVISVKVARTNMGKSKGFAFIDFATPALANAATELQIDLDGRTPEFRLSTPSPPRSDRPERTNRDDRPAREVRSASDGPRNPPSTTVWVGNVAWAVEEADIEDTFSRFGTVIRVSMPKDQESGRSRGIAYVEYADVDMAMNALASSTAEGLELEGRALRLDYAEVKSTSSFGSRGGAGGRGGFGGGRGGGRGGFGGRDGGSRGGYGGGGDRNGGGGGGYGGGRDGGGGGGYGGRGGSSGGRRGDDRASSQTVW